MAKSEFSTALRLQRRQLGLSQIALAKKLGVSTTSVVRWESGKQPREQGERDRILAALNGAPVPRREGMVRDESGVLQIGSPTNGIRLVLKVSPTLMVEIFADREQAQGIAQQAIAQL